jgi:hypothetical protein
MVDYFEKVGYDCVVFWNKDREFFKNDKDFLLNENIKVINKKIL